MLSFLAPLQGQEPEPTQMVYLPVLSRYLLELKFHYYTGSLASIYAYTINIGRTPFMETL